MRKYSKRVCKWLLWPILALGLFAGVLQSQVNVSLLPEPRIQFLDLNGNPVAAGRVGTFISGTSTLQAAYTDSTGATAHANPIILDSAGRQEIWLEDGLTYRIRLATTADVQIWQVDGVAGGGALTTALIVGTTAVTFSSTPTFNSSASTYFRMTLTANVTSSTISNSVAGGITYFNLCQDSTGGRTFAWPTTVLNPPSLGSAPSACTSASFIYDGTNWREIAPSSRGSAVFDTATTGVLNSVRVVDGYKFAQNSTGIQAAIDEVEAANGGEVFLPCGTYSITSALTVTMLSSSLGFRMTGSGLCTKLQPNAAMTVLTVNMGSSDYQNLHLADFAFDLNDTNSTAIALTAAGKQSVIERIFIENNSSSASADIITVDSNSHSVSFRNIRIRCDPGGASSSDGIHVAGNIITIDSSDISSCDSAVVIKGSGSTSQFNLLNSRLGSGVHGFRVEALTAVGILLEGNLFESNSAPHINIVGADDTTNRVFAVSILSNSFTGMDSADKDGIYLHRVDGVEIKGNHFDGDSSAEGVTFLTPVTEVSISGNIVDTVAVTMNNFDTVPLALSDVTATQTSSDLGFNRLYGGGTALVAGDFALHANWGSTAFITVTGTDSAFKIVVTSAGASIASYPNIVLTFTDGAWSSIPFAVCNRGGGADGAIPLSSRATTTTLTMDYQATPTSTSTYTFNCLVIG